MLGKFGDAQANVDLARQAADRNPQNHTIAQQYHTMLARYILETGAWRKIPIENSTDAPAAPAAMPGMPGMSGSGEGAWIFIAGLSAARLGDTQQAEQARVRLSAIRQSVESAGDAYAAKPLAIMRDEVASALHLALHQNSEAVRLAQQAADIEAALAPPSGPPEPIKPALEFYGELLLSEGKPSEAAAAFERQLLRTPNRTPSVDGLARATAKAAGPDTAGQR